MNIDQRYLKLLTNPLKGKDNFTMPTYLKALAQNGVKIKNDNGTVDTKFMHHIEFLIRTKRIQNNSPDQSLDGFGLSVGTNGHLVCWSASTLSYNEPPLKLKKLVWWGWNKVSAIIFAVLTGICTAIATGYLKI
ncbi:hypothetical protein P0F15_003471 [Vibrio metschnikovii]|nr:hypothetical protein [Vibrio metschnikovii]EKO3597780.1 hypothetical protein [Vibrio metschnikovii]EKO3633122.1 hypothetical protein [Vibrio metschnikovii]EKO3646729.1 hypothetical protein [Vibrio metschnikovii]EKO3681641.1 hypothetical protein [Vibrio metschnikovii]